MSTPGQLQGRGHLHLRRRGSHAYAYERWQKKGSRERSVYLGLPGSAPVQALFDARFQAQRLERLRHDQKVLEQARANYLPYDFDSVVSSMSRDYRQVARNSSFDQRYAELLAWARGSYEKNTYPFPASENYAKDGTRLRSKGECIWYNLLQERGILFRCDCKMVFRDKDGNEKTLYPDFLIQCFDGTLIIIEHLGRLGDLGYAIDFGERCHWYLQEDFVLGRNFFATSDDPYYGTDSQMIRRLIDRIEGMFYGF
ncbi:MAG: hypothetical protein IJ128_00165 [Firmicutes bacterium]|nr:hypothetical protein [Bacillota bacterium]